MELGRRSFLTALIGAAVLDPERLLWVTGRKLISIPKSLASPKDLTSVWLPTGTEAGFVFSVVNSSHEDLVAVSSDGFTERVASGTGMSFRSYEGGRWRKMSRMDALTDHYLEIGSTIVMSAIVPREHLIPSAPVARRARNGPKV